MTNGGSGGYPVMREECALSSELWLDAAVEGERDAWVVSGCGDQCPLRCCVVEVG